MPRIGQPASSTCVADIRFSGRGVPWPRSGELTLRSGNRFLRGRATAKYRGMALGMRVAYAPQGAGYFSVLSVDHGNVASVLLPPCTPGRSVIVRARPRRTLAQKMALRRRALPRVQMRRFPGRLQRRGLRGLLDLFA